MLKSHLVGAGVVGVLMGSSLLTVILPHEAIRAENQPKYDEPVTMTKADVFAIYSDLLSVQMQTNLGDRKEIEDIELVLVNDNDQTVLDLMFPVNAVATTQSRPPAQQMTEMQQLHKAFWKLFTRLASGAMGKNELGEMAIKSQYPSAMKRMVSELLSMRQLNDFVLRVGFSQDGKKHLYATVRQGGVEFNPACPTAKRGH